VSLGVTLGQGRRRAIELILGIALGIGIGDLLIAAIGAAARPTFPASRTPPLAYA
jgi:threonine/homoserine/homoserine lactone efflux protein